MAMILTILLTTSLMVIVLTFTMYCLLKR